MTARPCRLLIAIIDLDGGAGAFCRTLATALKRSFPGEFTISLLTCRQRGLLHADRTLFDRIRVLRSDVHTDGRRYYETIMHTMWMRNAIGRIGTDVILTVGTYTNLIVPFASPDRPTILTVHSNTTALLSDSRFGGVIRQLIRWRFPRSPVIGPSTGVARDLQVHFGVRRAEVIPHGVDAERIRALAARRVDDVPVSAPYLVTCGRLTAAKDYPTLLRAYAVARKRGLAEPLVLVGDGEERAALESLTRELGIANHVHFLGHRDNPYPYMARAKLFVLSSAWEGFGLVLIEAMALGLPCLSTDCPSGPGEILGGGEFGRLVRPRDVEALAGAMFEFATSPVELEHFARQSAQRVQDYSLERMARRYRDHFNRIRQSSITGGWLPRE
ncbi:MAG: glycosyltransferase [Tepidisphaeraceae bacterium]